MSEFYSIGVEPKERANPDRRLAASVISAALEDLATGQHRPQARRSKVSLFSV